MKNFKIKEKGKEMKWKEEENKEAVQRVACFMQEEDEAFFQRMIYGLTLPEIEEFLEECPEFRRFWNKEQSIYSGM